MQTQIGPIPAPTPPQTRPRNLFDQSLLDLLPAISTSILVVTTLIALLRWLYKRYLATFGRRADLRKRLNRLAAGIRLEYIEQLFDEPVFRNKNGNLIESIWWLQDAVLQTISRVDDGAVERYSITLMSAKLHLRFALPSLRLKLGSTTYAELDADPQRIRLGIGARRLFYEEEYYFGNPSFYQTYTVSYNDVSNMGSPGNFFTQLHEQMLYDTDPRDSQQSDEVRQLLKSFRASTTPNTLSVETTRGTIEPLPFTFGADKDLIRVLPDYLSQH